MNEIFNIICELNKENGSNYKMSVLKKYQDNQILKTVLKMTYDHVVFNYGVGKTTLEKIDHDNLIEHSCNLSVENLLDILENEFSTREVTGNAAITKLQEMLSNTGTDNRWLLQKIIERDLRINLGKTQINKVFKGLITKPIYMRCDTYNKKTSKNISYPAIIQLKADGTYREFSVQNGVVLAQSRSGEKYEYPVIAEEMKNYTDGIYTGELTVKGISDRAEGNGLINSSNPPHDDIILELWDFISHAEYVQAGAKDKKNPPTTPYLTRWNCLNNEVKSSENVKTIPFKIVENLKEALQQTSEWMTAGFEGGVLKDFGMIFKDGTSKQQLKLKLIISLEMRCTGTKDGTKGTKREGKVGAILFENDEGTIKGACSGFTDKQMDEFTAIRNELPERIMEVECNDITKGRNNDYHALSHPRFIEWRDDKDETDTLEKAFKLKEMAMELS